MRSIKYILVNDTVNKTPSGAPVRYDASNLGHHYVINSAGAVLKLINVCRPGSFMPKPTCGEEDLNKCSIGIKFNGSLESGTLNLELRARLIHLLVELRSHFPDAKILGVSELGLEVRDQRIVSSRRLCPNDAMNSIRRTLSDLP